MSLIKNEIPIFEYDTEKNSYPYAGTLMGLSFYRESSFIIYGTGN